MINENTVKCDGCGSETNKSMAIDNWAVKEDVESGIITRKHYCRICQSKMKIGWHTENRSNMRIPDDIIFAFNQ